MQTFYWYDYETFGILPKISRIAQFGGIRTDKDLNIIDKHMFYCKPTNDSLPSPQACAITGITPQECAKKGMIEHEFISKINSQFCVANTCIVGYNSIRFDDEFTRHTLYRNFIDPYAWHWQNFNSRWDILDVVRLCYALKKDNSLNWVYNQDGVPIFKLDQLAPANNIEHSGAHDALADVKATIAIAKIIKTKQPKLFDYAFSLRDKKVVANKIELFTPMLHTSGMYKAQESCTKMVTTIAHHPQYNDRAIVFNLEQDPSILLDLNIEELKKLTFSKQDDLPEGVNRLQIKELVFNKSPMFVPNVYKIEPKIAQQLKIDTNKTKKHLEFIKNNQDKIKQIAQNIYKNEQTLAASTDVDQSLYEGFIDNFDKKICTTIQNMSGADFKTFNPRFKDTRLTKLLMHFKARNYPESLTPDEQEEWFEIVQNRVQEGVNGYTSITNYNEEIKALRIQYPDKEHIWKQLDKYCELFL